MNIAQIHRGDVAFPANLDPCLREHAPESLTAIGNVELLETKPLALFCSVRCPGNLILKTYDLARRLRDCGVSVISGFHSPMEKECLDILLRGTQPIIVCPARGIEKMRIPRAWKTAIEANRLLVLSPFKSERNQADSKMAHIRNELVAALADRVFISFAEVGGRTERLAETVVAWKKSLLTLSDDANRNLITMGAVLYPLD